MSSRKNLVIILGNAFLRYLFFCFHYIYRVLSAFGCLMEGWWGEQGAWAAQQGTRSQRALNPCPSKPSLAVGAALMVVNLPWPVQVRLILPMGLVQKLLSIVSVGQTGRSRVPVMHHKNWASLGLLALACRDCVACPLLPLLLAPFAAEGKAWGRGLH